MYNRQIIHTCSISWVIEYRFFRYSVVLFQSTLIAGVRVKLSIYEVLEDDCKVSTYIFYNVI